MKMSVETPRGLAVGIGKVKIKRTPEFDFKIQMLSFVVIQQNPDSFIATCIHLQMDGYGKTQQKAIIDMAENVQEFLTQNFTNPICRDNAWGNLEKRFMSNEWSIKMWDIYHQVQIRLCILGKSTDTMEDLWEWVKKLEKRIARLESEEAKAIRSELIGIQNIRVGYNSIEEAA